MKMQILIVEDEAVLGMYVSDLLEASGYQVVDVVDNGREALSIFQQQHVDLLLCDIHIRGDWDGIETVNKIAEIREVPVIYLTAFADRETVERAKQTYPSAYLSKPVRSDNLKLAVELALSNFARHKSVGISLSEQKTVDKEAGKESILLADDHVFIKNNYQFVRIPLADILMLQADNTYTHIITPYQKLTLRQTMSGTQEKLGFASLVRVHRSFVVNLKKITGFNDREIFIGDTVVPLGAQYKDGFMSFFTSR
ncbi:DNA-binding response regulator [Dyadobacter luteus]|uniref:DNA-binding response regulator n=2 Tax=Dyadobacter luteus TaxID=2259619 RepID=A0A3D8YER9_9BACT|nr:DNA-binding response regulator [Dyadobacter luteus]